MIKVALDTNFLVLLCNDKNLLQAVLDVKPTASLYIQRRSIQEFNNGATDNEMLQFEKLKLICEIDYDRYFTIGVSTIGGPDMISGGSYEALATDYSEKEYIKSGTNKSRSEWIISRQGDATIVSFANEKGCELIVTDDKGLQKKLKDQPKLPQALSSREFFNRYIYQ